MTSGDIRCERCGGPVDDRSDGGVGCPACGEVTRVPNARMGLRVRGVALHSAPWAISLLAHVVVAVVLMFVFIFMAESDDEDVVVPHARLTDTPGGKLSLAPDPDAPEPVIAERPTVQTPPSAAAESLVLAELVEPEDLQLERMDDDPAFGGVFAAPAADGGLAEPISEFFGDGGNAHHIVYVVDCSGSMYSSLGTPDSPGPVRLEMLRSISELRPAQDFHVIFFAAGTPRECSTRRLVPATDAFKLAAARFMRTIRPDVSTDPMPAMRRAFDVLSRADRRRSGKLIYLLTDGEDFPDRNEIMTTLAALNADGSVHINTILYDHRPGTVGGASLLRQIAQTHGGWFKHVVENE